MDNLLEYLKRDYDYLVFKSDEELYNNLDIVREKCNCVEEFVEEFEGYGGKKFKITSIKIGLK